MRLGAHISIRKGFQEMAKDARRLGLETAQVFTRSPRGGQAREIPKREAEAAQALLVEAGVQPLVVHTPYLVNLGAEDDKKRGYSVEITALDLLRADILGAAYVVAHVGRYDVSLDRGIDVVAASIDTIVDATGSDARLCLENTAGQGKELGYRFSHIRQVLEKARRGKDVRICLDTSHAFASGYDVSSEEGWASLLEEFEREIGLDMLAVVHCNDSAGDLGSRVDRHRNIGKGQIGVSGFRAMLRRPELKGLPCILETPVDSIDDFKADLDVLRSLRQES